MGLRLVSGVWRRRIVRIRNNQNEPRLVLSGINGLFALTGLRLIPLFPLRRRLLIRRKLDRFHHHYGGSRSYHRSSLKMQWRDYNRVLSRSRYPLIDYDSWIEYVELPWLMHQDVQSLNSKIDSSLVSAISIKLWFWSKCQKSYLKDLSLNSWNNQRPGFYGIVDEFPVYSIAPNSTWICPLKPGDQLAPHALRSLSQVTKSHQKARLIYADEDHIDFNGRRHSPQFKPAWNQELFYSDQCYSHCWLISEDLYNQAISRLIEFGEIITLYSLMLEATSLCSSDEIIHLPEVLYHCVDFDVMSRGDLTSANMVKIIFVVWVIMLMLDTRKKVVIY